MPEILWLIYFGEIVREIWRVERREKTILGSEILAADAAAAQARWTKTRIA